MNALDAASKISSLRERLVALGSVIYYLKDDYEWRDKILVVEEIEEEMQADLDALEAKLRAVNV